MTSTFKVVTVWLLVGVAVFLGVQWSQHSAQRSLMTVSGGSIDIRRGPDGHYHWAGRINGRAVDFLIDTGATRSALSSSLARELNLERLGDTQSNTANGVVRGQIVRGDLTLEGGVRVDRLTMTALPDLGGHPLLGMDVLGRLRWQQRDGVLRIELESTR